MKNRIVASIVAVLLVLCSVQVTLNFAHVVLSEPDAGRREIWELVWINNTLPYNTVVDVNVSVNSRKGVNIACSNGTTAYFNNATAQTAYGNYSNWLNGTSTLTYHWGEMKWSVSNGSLTPIGYSDIQFWGDMYLDSGGGVNYTTFMGNTFMADWNLSDSNNQPDIVYQPYWQGNQIKMINAMFVPASANITLVFDIVLTETGSYTFNIITTPGVTVSPSTWTVGGVRTILVPYDYSTIQAAVNAASDGDTIVVAAGTYNENQILITKALTVYGAGAGATIVDGQLVAPPTVGLVRITANTGNVIFSGFTVRNAGKISGTRVGIYAQCALPGVTYTISNDTIYGINDPNDDQDYGVYAYQGNESLVFTNNSITQTGANPILIEQHLGPVEISYNTLDVGVWGSDAIFCMTYGGYNVTTLQRIRNNTINMGTGGNPFDIDHRATGITFASSYNSAVLGNGTFTNIQITGNTIFNLASYRRGITLWNSATGDGTGGNIVSAQITGNTISGTNASESYGIRLLGLVTNVSISGNNITNNAYGIDLNNANGALVTYNNIFSNFIYGINNAGSEPLSAKYNWWGSETGPNYAGSQYPSSPGDSVTDGVLFEPWLIKPYPPIVPITVVNVNPQFTVLAVPALGKLFTVNVTISNVTLMYGFQFTLKWNSTLLTLTNPTTAYRIPAAWGTNYLSPNATYNLLGGNYSLFESARSPAPPFNGTVIVGSFVFRAVYDPVYPNNVTCNLSLENVIVSDPASNSIKRLVYGGNYTSNSAKPKLLFTANEYTAKQVPTEFDAYINVTNVVNLSGFNFEFKFNGALLSVLYVNVSSFSGNPTVLIGWLSDTVYVNVTGISPWANGTMTLARVHFKVQSGFVWNTQIRGVNSTLDFTVHELNNGTIGTIDNDAVNGVYRYTPVPGDLDMDGQVTIVDLSAAAHVFGASSTDAGWNPIAFMDLNLDGTINILDIVLIARNFGRTTPEQ